MGDGEEEGGGGGEGGSTLEEEFIGLMLDISNDIIS